MILDKILNFDLSNTAIFTGAVVDPDGLASGLAMKAIVENVGGKVALFHRGPFNRLQNKTMKELLKINIVSSEDFEDLNDSSEFTCIISSDGPGEVCPSTPHFIIDHHKPGESAQIATDVREIGSASALHWEYLIKAMPDEWFESEDGALCCAALAIGIQTDTNLFQDPKTSPLDKEAYAFCLLRANNTIFNGILNYPRPPYFQDMKCGAWNQKYWPKNSTFMAAPLGDIPEERTGIISECADEFGSTRGIETCLVVAMSGDTLLASARSNDPSLDMDAFMKKLMGKNAGGKSGAGAGRRDIFFLDGATPEIRDGLFKASYEALIHRAAKIVGDGEVAERSFNPDAEMIKMARTKEGRK